MFLSTGAFSVGADVIFLRLGQQPGTIKQTPFGDAQPNGAFIMDINNRHKKTLASIFAIPTRANITWTDIERLFLALGATVKEGRGSRVRIELNGEDAVFHRPHPRKDTVKGAVESVRDFLETAGIVPEEDD
jgi:HicA toxin of bacterial toxin-antitoxin,